MKEPASYYATTNESLLARNLAFGTSRENGVQKVHTLMKCALKNMSLQNLIRP